MKALKTVVLFIALLLIMAVPSAYSQTATGDIVGRVTDQQGAVIPNVTVTARETSTGVVRTTITNGEGDYDFGSLPPGNYEVSTQVANMSRGMSTVQLLLGAKQTINFTLNPATTGTTVEVTGAAPLIETSNSELKANIDSRQMTELPLNGRTFASLAVLAPGVRPVGSFDPTKTRIGTVSINGSTGRNFNLSVDGGDNKDNVVGGFLQNYTTEGIQEFVIDTHRFGADTGKSAGGAVTIATKGGTNNLHGGAFIYERQKNLNATDFFTAHKSDAVLDSSGKPVPDPTAPSGVKAQPCPPCYGGGANPKPPFDRQNFGGSLGGPIIHDRAYFFGAVERVHENAAVAQNGNTLTSLAAFKALQPTLTNAALRAYPVDLSSFVPLPFRDTQWQTRADFNLSSKHQLFVRYAQQNNELSHDNLDGLEDPNSGSETRNILNSILVNHAWVVSTNKLNQFVFQYSKFFNSLSPEPASVGVPNIVFANGGSLGQNSLDPQTTEQQKYQFRDDFSWRVGKHSFKFGGQEVEVTKFGGRFAFNNTTQVQLRADPEDLTSLETAGIVRRTLLANGTDTFFQPKVHQLSYYVQDDWKVTPRLTLNLGVRNDIDFDLVPTDDQVPSSSTARICPAGCTGNRGLRILSLLPQTQLNALVPGLSLNHPRNDTNNWAPRIGFAYDVTGTGKWLVRGGYGMFFDQLFQNVTLFAVQQANPNVYAVAYDVRSGSSGSGAIGISQAVAAAGTPTKTLPDLPYGSRARYVTSKFQNPYAQHATLGTQYEVMKNTVLSVDFVHVLSLHEFAQREINPASDGGNNSRLLNALMDPVFGCANVFGSPLTCGTSGALHRLHRVTEASSDNRSRYDSVTFDLKRRFANHYQFGASYILSKARTYGGVSADFGSISQGINPRIVGNNSLGETPAQRSALLGIIQPQNFGYASEDERHRFTFNGLAELPWGFLVSGIVQLSSARPYSMFADDDINGDGTFTDLYSPHVATNCGAAASTDVLCEGDPRLAEHPNSLRGEPYYQTDLRVQKSFRIRERFGVQLVADMFNVFSHTNFGNSFVNNSDAFGAQQPTVPVLDGVDGPAAKQLPHKPTALFGGGFGGAGTVGIPFQAQFGLRITF